MVGRARVTSNVRVVSRCESEPAVVSSAEVPAEFRQPPSKPGVFVVAARTIGATSLITSIAVAGGDDLGGTGSSARNDLEDVSEDAHDVEFAVRVLTKGTEELEA